MGKGDPRTKRGKIFKGSLELKDAAKQKQEKITQSLFSRQLLPFISRNSSDSESQTFFQGGLSID